ncbi:hypothetical protein P5G50_00170 [Leifsonia sp. F6_8S_P_1B]|uniref:Energy-coupling factor transport system substrate-specific component n=1 Tax=Leifsonia williamsii TaxID=3035919 RepID=A0ABT8K5W3_9MICO|nr:hypothetical protein [Leifsonia williamsii]MDN4612848.1 hypothetical protein [Leifsonia williamsii]
MTLHQSATAGDRRLPLLRVLFTLVAAGAGSALIVLAFSPFSAAAAAFSAPLYAVVAGGYSFLPFLARRLLGLPWAATAAGCLAGVLSAPISPIGLLIVVPFVAGGAAYDAVAWALARAPWLADRDRWVFTIAAAVSALVLFIVSLPVFSPVNRGLPLFLAAVLAGRLVGQLAASALAGLAADALHRFGPQRR